MATLLQPDTRRLYSWWWDSHISPKNSKWLQENLKDMDCKVKAMIKLIEEDADSFARRAEMYYKKRPELMKLVEEFYRAYRALAERYDHATGELRQAHRTMAEVFPNQVPFVLADDSPSGSSAQETDPHTPEMAHPSRPLPLLDSDDLHKDTLSLSTSELQAMKKYLSEYSSGSNRKQLCQIFGAEVETHKVRKGLSIDLEEADQNLSNENQTPKTKDCSEADHPSKTGADIEKFKKALSDMEDEKETASLEYQKCLEKLQNLEEELSRAQDDCAQLNKEAKIAETEIQTLKETLVKLQNERDSGFLMNKESMERISYLQDEVSHAQNEAKVYNKRAIRAEVQAQYLKDECQRLESEREADLYRYNQCLDKIRDLESKLLVAEEAAKLLDERVDRAETKANNLKRALAELNAEKEAVAFQYEHCLEKLSKLECDISNAHNEVEHLNGEILERAEKLKSAEEKCTLIEISNQSLLLEADNLVKQISIKDQELSKKQEELEKLKTCIQEERISHGQVKATLQTLQDLHSHEQEGQRALASELKNGLQVLKEMEVQKHDQEEQIQHLKEENKNLTELNSSSSFSIKSLQEELLNMREVKNRLEKEVVSEMNRGNCLEQEIVHLKEEIDGLNKRYQALINEMDLVGLNHESFILAVKNLQFENSRLRKSHEKERDEKEVLSDKLVHMEELQQKNAILESSLSDVNYELEVSIKKVKALQDSCELLNGEKCSLVAEKASLLSQLLIVTENMQKLLEKNTVLENFLSDANAELQRLMVKSKSLEEICQLLTHEKSNLLAEKSALISRLENVEERLQVLEKRFTGMEEKYAGMEKEKEFAHAQLKELNFSVSADKQEQVNFTLWTKSQLANLQTTVHFMQEDSRWRKKNFEEEFDKAVNAQFEIFILQKFIQDMEEKNYTLLIECHKHVEASNLAEKLISELEIENLEQQVEVELLLDEIRKLRLGIYQVFKALEIVSDSETESKSETEQILLHKTLGNIGNMKHSLSKYNDDSQQLLVENSVLTTLLKQLAMEGMKVESEKIILDLECKSVMEQVQLLHNDRKELLELNEQLRSDVSKGDQQAKMLKAEADNFFLSHLNLREEYSQLLKENQSLLRKFLDLESEKCMIEKENDSFLLETLTNGFLFTISKTLGTEKVAELKSASDELQKVHGINNELEKEATSLRENFEMKAMENLHLKDSVVRLESELYGCKQLNTHMEQQISFGHDALRQRDMMLSEAEQKFTDAENLNSELLKILEGVKQELKESKFKGENLETQISELSEDNVSRIKEIKSLNEINGNLKSELSILHEEIKEKRMAEENLNSELQEMSNGFEIWEAEATSFYFDLQIASIREVFFENKVQELTGVCLNLEDESALKSMEIEQMKEKVSVMESEIEGVRGQLHEYEPDIASLSDEIACLERNVVAQIKLNIGGSQEQKNVDETFNSHKESSIELVEDQGGPGPNGILDLKALQRKIKTIEKLLVEEMKKIAMQESLNTNVKLEAAVREIEDLRKQCGSNQNEGMEKEERKAGREFTNDETEPQPPELKNSILMKDIPLDHISGSLHGVSRRGSRGPDDQMLELWQTDEGCATDPSQKWLCASTNNEIICHQHGGEERMSANPSSELELEKELGIDKLEVSMAVPKQSGDGTGGKILERLASDAQRLSTIQMMVENVRKKLVSNKKNKSSDIDYEILRDQLQEVEETIVQMVDLNGQLSRNIDVDPSGPYAEASPELRESVNLWRKRISEQACKESEKIGRLHLEVQKIQYLLLKLEDEKKCKRSIESSRNKTTIGLRNFIYSGRRQNGRQRKAHICGCFRPSTNGDGDHI